MKDRIARLQAHVDHLLVRKPDLDILEAGCGSASHLRFPGKRVRLTGIDISPEQLQRNTALDAAILGDIQHHDFTPSSFDVVVCWDVLEHLPRPDLALKRMLRALKHEGLLVLALPHVMSLNGLITKYTPHGVHVWFYRHLLGNRKAGRAGCAPFQTHLKFSTRPESVMHYAAGNRGSIAYFDAYDYFYNLPTRHRFLYHAVRLVKALIKYASLGTIDKSNYILVIRKHAESVGAQ
jgi:SAM-dependent methyltransferase